MAQCKETREPMIALTLAEILKLVPQRPPFLFVRSAAIRNEGEIEGTCGWDVDNPILSGHFPGLAIVPGVLLVEAAAQLAGILIARCSPNHAAEGDVPMRMLTTIRRAMIHRPVFPDHEVGCSVTLDTPVGGMYGAHAVGRTGNGGHKIFSCEMVIAVVERSKLLGDRAA